jgi:hypothetical protein
MHYDCFDKYMESQLKKSAEQQDMVTDSSRLQFFCPLCKKLGNLFVPFVETNQARIAQQEAHKVKQAASALRKKDAAAAAAASEDVSVPMEVAATKEKVLPIFADAAGAEGVVAPVVTPEGVCETSRAGMTALPRVNPLPPAAGPRESTPLAWLPMSNSLAADAADATASGAKTGPNATEDPALLADTLRLLYGSTGSCTSGSCNTSTSTSTSGRGGGGGGDGVKSKAKGGRRIKRIRSKSLVPGGSPHRTQGRPIARLGSHDADASPGAAAAAATTSTVESGDAGAGAGAGAVAGGVATSESELAEAMEDAVLSTEDDWSEEDGEEDSENGDQEGEDEDDAVVDVSASASASASASVALSAAVESTLMRQVGNGVGEEEDTAAEAEEDADAAARMDIENILQLAFQFDEEEAAANRVLAPLEASRKRNRVRTVAGYVASLAPSLRYLKGTSAANHKGLSAALDSKLRRALGRAQPEYRAAFYKRKAWAMCVHFLCLLLFCGYNEPSFIVDTDISMVCSKTYLRLLFIYLFILFFSSCFF